MSTPPGPGCDHDYAHRYVVGGSDFRRHMDVGRRWRANTDGLIFEGFSGDVFGIDLAAVADDEAGSWPLGRYSPLNLLDDGTGQVRSAYAEICWSGSTWSEIPKKCLIADDELAIRLTASDLRLICNPANDKENLWRRLKADSPPAIRLVCCVFAPHRNIAWPSRRPGAGTMFNQAAWIDRGAAWQVRRRAASSPLLQTLGDVGTSDGTVGGLTIDHDAIAVQAAAESRLMHADLPLEVPDPSIRLTGVVTEIAGVGIDLSTNAGPAAVYPRIIGVRMDFQKWSQSLTLDDDRKAAVT